MRNNKYKSSMNKRYFSNKPDNINPQYFRNKIYEAKKLYMPQYNNLSKSKVDIYKNMEDNYNMGASKKYLKFKEILNNYMNDYEKLKKQNKIQDFEEKNYYSYQEFELKKNNVRELFDSIIDLNGRDEFNDTDKIIQNLPDDFDNMFLKNEFTKNDYAMRYEIINGEKLEETNERLRSKTENNINQDINKLNQNIFFENNEEEEEAENADNNINKNIKEQKEIKNNNIINKNNNIINKDEEININIKNEIIEEVNNNKNGNNNKFEEEEKNNNEETSKEKNNNIDEQSNSNNNNELNSDNKIDEEKSKDNKNEQIIRINIKFEGGNEEEQKEENEEEQNEENEEEKKEETNEEKKEENEEEKKEENEEEKKENNEEEKKDIDNSNNNNIEEKKELEGEIEQNRFKKFKESEEKEMTEEKERQEESMEKYDDFE